MPLYSIKSEKLGTAKNLLWPGKIVYSDQKGLSQDSDQEVIANLNQFSDAPHPIGQSLRGSARENGRGTPTETYSSNY